MLKPTRGKILGEVLSEETISKGGIILARTIKEEPHRAKVIALGKSIKDKKPIANIGDIVHFKEGFGKIWGDEIKGGKFKKYIFLKDDEIIARETDGK